MYYSRSPAEVLGAEEYGTRVHLFFRYSYVCYIATSAPCSCLHNGHSEIRGLVDYPTPHQCHGYWAENGWFLEKKNNKIRFYKKNSNRISKNKIFVKFEVNMPDLP